MFNECEGFFGQWFGHNYQSKIIESKWPDHGKIKAPGCRDVREAKDNKYVVVCTRCGDVIENAK